MTQAQELEEIDRYVNRCKPINVESQKLIQDWKNWYSTRNFWQKNMDSESLQFAREFRNELTSALTNQPEMSAESKAAGNYTKKGTVVPTPPGYRRATQAEITPKVQGFAVAALKNFAKTSTKKGEAAAIGLRYAGVVNGKQYLSQCEWHFDNHPKGGKGDPYYHMGSSIFVPINPIPPPANSQFRTMDQGVASINTGNNPYA